MNNLLQSKTKFTLLSAALLGLGAIWIWLSAAPPNSTTAGRIPAPQAGFLAPDFTLETSTGDRITLADLQGRPVLINLWASWCAPCRQEMPAIQRISEKYKDSGLVVLAVNITSQDSEASALSFAAEHGLTFPILLDRTGEVAQLYENRALPSTYFVDTEGVITEVVIGGPMAEALLATRVEQLLPKGGE